ncbi:MAG TPA: S9 family peptidase, partial [Candidatus Limnocylindrales bacterium]|nr:S9 family peptidase [Candidatus Limnocylindrales bacterium]
MLAVKEIPFGAWPSPLSIELLTAGAVGLSSPSFDRGPDGLWWLEGRPEEGGIQVLVRWREGVGPTDVSPPGFNVRTRVHEYGGAPVLVAGELIVASDFATGRLHRILPGRTSEPLTLEGPFRYADLVLDAERDRLIGVREDHSGDGEAVNELVTIALTDGAVTPLVTGADFYAAPRLSPDGRRLAWLEWRHPNMPWDGTELWVAELGADGTLDERVRVAGSTTDWISQPRWSPDGVLHFVAEPDGWMNLQRWRDGRIERVTPPIEAEFAGPDWVFGTRQYAFADGGGILAVARSNGADRLYRIAPDGTVTGIEVPWTALGSIDLAGDRLVTAAASPSEPWSIVRLEVATGSHEILRRSTAAEIDPAYVSIPESIAFPTTDGATAYGHYYPPRNPDVVAPPGTRPPLIVTSHGGPTAEASTARSTRTQLLTSRGIAVLDVDYRGSTGHGKAYRQALEGRWGVVDVDDCVAGAQFLAERGDVDPDRIAIEGGSASGYTTLCALAFRDAFRAGITSFGIGDLMAFARETHKFESRYLDRLVGPLPDAADVYRERSPAFHMDQCTCPVLVLQGLDDRIVPPSEAERIVDSLWERRLPHAYLAFEGEGHGFRKAA